MRLSIEIKLVEDGRAQALLELFTATTGQGVVLLVCVEIGLEDAGGADWEEILIDDGIYAQEAQRDQRIDIRRNSGGARGSNAGIGW